MDKIKPCPFCGAECGVRGVNGVDEDLYRIRCNESAEHGQLCWYSSEEEAIKAWNQRAKPEKMYLVYYSQIHLLFGSYSEDLLFVTENKEKAEAYVEKFNAGLKKWKDYYRGVLDRHQYEAENTASSPKWIISRFYQLGNIHQCFYKELEVR